MARSVGRWMALVAVAALILLVLLGLQPGRPGRGGLQAQAQAPVGLEPAARIDPWKAPDLPTRSEMIYDTWETIGVSDGLPSDRVTTLLVEADALWVGTDRGLAVRRNDEWTVYTRDDGLAHGYITALARDNGAGDLWIGTLAGLSRLSGGAIRSFTQMNSGLANDVVYDVEAEDGLIWTATAAGVCCLDTRDMSWLVRDHLNSIMHEPWCYSVATGAGHLWVGVWGGGVVELELERGTWREYRDPDGEMEIDLLKDDGPIHDVSAFVAYDQGVLWQATYFGLSRYDGRRWRSYVAADTGLAGDFISHVHARGHTVWIASDQGLSVFDGETCVTYLRDDRGHCVVSSWRGGEQMETHELETAFADNYLLWVQANEEEVWLATGRGLSHGFKTK